jgi:S-adenosylmethionine synthetase
MANPHHESPQYFYTSESVSRGIPIRCAIRFPTPSVAILEKDPNGRVACEVATTTGRSSSSARSRPTLRGHGRRRAVRDIGYTRAKFGFDAYCGVIVSIKEQSQDIAQGVNKALEAREMSDDDIDRIGAGDQGMMIGFACNETPEFMPTSISLAHRLVRTLAEVRKSGVLPWLRPDGKSQVTIEYEYGRPKRVDTILISAQHAPDISYENIREAIVECVMKPVIPGNLFDRDTKIFVNPTGRFVTGGPLGDSGLTGRKIIVDTYGGVARHGGGAFSGKDATKVDRSAAYMARYIAKNVVAAGLAERCELQVSYAIGVAHPLSLAVETFGTGKIEDEMLEKLIRRHFDMRPAAIIRDLDLRKPIFRQVAAYGHFGRDDLNVTWERTDKAAVLRQEAGL